MSLNKYFDPVLCINLDTRPDRWESAVAQADKFWIGMKPVRAVKNSGWLGCYASHVIAWQCIAACATYAGLVLEDDFQIIHEDFNERLGVLMGQIGPGNFDVLYLGGNPRLGQTRVSPNVDLTLGMATTSSYAITPQFAKELLSRLPLVPRQPIDDVLINAARDNRFYVAYPRLISQFGNFSDIEGRPRDYSCDMVD